MDVMQGLRLSSKGQLTYDLDWKPTKQALDECSISPKIGIEFTPVIDDLNYEDRNSKINESKEDDTSIRTDLTYDKELTLETRKQISKQNEQKQKQKFLEYFGPEKIDVSHVHIHRYEKDKEEEVKQRGNQRALLFEKHTEQLKEEKKLYLHRKYEERRNNFLEEVQALQEDVRNKSIEVRNRQRALEQLHKETAARAVRKVKEVEELRQKLAMEEERNRKEIMQVNAIHQELLMTIKKLGDLLKNCPNISHLSDTARTLVQEANKLGALSMNTVKTTREMGKVPVGAAKSLQEYLALGKALLGRGVNAMAEAEQKVAKEIAEVAAKVKEEEVKKQEQEKKKAEKEAAAVKAKEKATAVPEYLMNCISETAFKEYTRLEKLLENTEKEIEPLAKPKDPTLKKLKLELNKAVTTPINTISDQSPTHLLEKIHSLKKLLSGQSVSQGGKTISTSSHPLALLYCKNWLARKIVQQGSSQVSSNHSAAFPFAAVAIELWSAYPDVGDLILAHFYKECPFLVPLYIPRAAGTSDTDYFKALGYQCSGDQIEAVDKYLKRMTGTVRLYAAILSSPPPRGATHPHSIANGWAWLARVLNLPPKPDYTATAIYEFLAVSGHALAREYRGQFWKLLLVLCHEFVSKIDQVSSPAQSGPVVRLKGFLTKCIHNRSMQVPEGFLTPAWWNSSSGYAAVIGC